MRTCAEAHVIIWCEEAALAIGTWVFLFRYLGTLAVSVLGCWKPFLNGKVSYCAESLLGFGTALLAKERYDHEILLTWCRCSYMYMCMQVHDSGYHQCKQDQHYAQAVSPCCNHPNGDGWLALSTWHCLTRMMLAFWINFTEQFDHSTYSVHYVYYTGCTIDNNVTIIKLESSHSATIFKLLLTIFPCIADLLPPSIFCSTVTKQFGNHWESNHLETIQNYTIVQFQSILQCVQWKYIFSNSAILNVFELEKLFFVDASCKMAVYKMIYWYH